MSFSVSIAPPSPKYTKNRCAISDVPANHSIIVLSFHRQQIHRRGGGAAHFGKLALIARGKRIVRTEEEEAALYSPSSLRTEDCTLKAIPYCLWNNRTPGEMRVWLEAILP